MRYTNIELKGISGVGSEIMTTPAEQLKDIISKGLVIDIFQAEEALALNRSIGKNAVAINKNNYGNLFGSIQFILSRHFILTVARLYEAPNPRYPIRSIPRVLEFLKENAGRLIIEQKAYLRKKLTALGLDQETLSIMTDAEITGAVVKYFFGTLPVAKLEEGTGDLSNALAVLKTTRDKAIAHHEVINAADLPTTSWAEATQLVEYAKQFVATIGMGYLGVIYETNGEYILSTNAERSSRALNRLLVQARLLEKKW